MKTNTEELMKKSLLSVILAAVITATCLGLTACGGENYSETYTGTLSQEKYSTDEQAAQAFFEKEIKNASNAEDVKYLRFSVEDTALTEEEISALDI